MVKPLKINLNTQREILQEGVQKSISTSAGFHVVYLNLFLVVLPFCFRILEA
jgi:hypothetical protein